jgi:homogentisate 1,2-dioxygenase
MGLVSDFLSFVFYFPRLSSTRRKHFPYEDYDEWLFGESGVWSVNASERRPDLLVLQMTLHSCVHGMDPHREGHHNASMIRKHEEDVAALMKAVRVAVDRPPRITTVIVMTGGRNFLKGNQS